MDLGTVPDWISALANFAVAAAACFAAWQGVKSLTQWRDEQLGRRRIELADETLAGVFEARDILHAARIHYVYSWEGVTRPGREFEPDDEIRHRRDMYFIALNRLEARTDFFSHLEARQYRVRATFGHEIADRLSELLDIRRNVQRRAGAMMKMAHMEDGSERDVQRTAEGHAIIWAGTERNDVISQRVDALTTELEQAFRVEFVGAASMKTGPVPGSPIIRR